MLNKFKQYPLWKQTVITILFLFLVAQLVSMIPDKKTAVDCSIYYPSTFLGVTVDAKAKFEQCYASNSCHPTTFTGTNDVVISSINKFVGLFGDTVIYKGCVAEAEIGEYVIIDSKNKGCKSGASVSMGTIDQYPVYMCIEDTSLPEEKCKNNAEKSVSNLANKVGIDTGSCKTDYYIVIFGGGFLALILILAIL